MINFLILKRFHHCVASVCLLCGLHVRPHNIIIVSSLKTSCNKTIFFFAFFYTMEIFYIIVKFGGISNIILSYVPIPIYSYNNIKNNNNATEWRGE